VLRTAPEATHPGGLSPSGAWDGTGNVWEWTSWLHQWHPWRAGDAREEETSGEKWDLPAAGQHSTDTKRARPESSDSALALSSRTAAVVSVNQAMRRQAVYVSGSLPRPGWQDHGVDDVNHTVTRHDVLDDHL
jgi:hypothetical protein